MNDESKLIVELWEYFRDLLGAAKRQDAATHLLRLFEEYGIDIHKADIHGECEYLDEGLLMLSDDHEYEEDLDDDSSHEY